MKKNSNRKPGALSQMGWSPAEFHFRFGLFSLLEPVFCFLCGGHFEKNSNANSSRTEVSRAVKLSTIIVPRRPLPDGDVIGPRPLPVSGLSAFKKISKKSIFAPTVCNLSKLHMPFDDA